MFIENVSQLDKDSLVDPQLFDELFAIEDEFDREQKIQELQDKAKEKGCKGRFDDLLKAKKKSVRAEIKKMMP